MLMTAARRLLRALPPWAQTPVRRAWHGVRGHRAAEPPEPALVRQRRALAAIGAGHIERPDINELLHHLRGRHLRELPQGLPHFVSVGCAGTWYFNWVNECCAPRRHTGVEFYSPRPDDLPSNARWIANTAGDLRDLDDGCADLVFSGQNIEHLWPRDISGFLLESHRVLRPGALLVVDSPNRLVTGPLGWSHPEHTVEFSAAEMHELLQLAGFDARNTEGLWLCRDPSGGLLPFDALDPDGPWPAARRCEAARNDPDRAFIWWITAERSARAAQPARLRERVLELFMQAWPERLNRLMTQAGELEQRDDGPWLHSGGRPGALLFGPYAALPAGHHEVTFTFEAAQAPTASLATCRVTSQNGQRVWAEADFGPATPGRHTLTLAFNLPDTTFGMEFVVVSGEVPVSVRKAVALRSEASL